MPIHLGRGPAKFQEQRNRGKRAVLLQERSIKRRSSQWIVSREKDLDEMKFIDGTYQVSTWGQWKRRLSMGFSEEIEDAKITAEKTKISRLKRRSENWPKFAWSNWTLRYKTVKTRKHYRKHLLFLNFGIWLHCDFDNGVKSDNSRWNHMMPLQGWKRQK